MVRNLGQDVPDVFNSIQLQGQKFLRQIPSSALAAKNMVRACGFQWGVRVGMQV